MLFLFVVLPIFLVSLFTGVDTWLWRALLFAAVAVCWLWSGVLALVLAVGLVIGIAFKSSLHAVTGSPV